jgi:hypothetical protein
VKKNSFLFGFLLIYSYLCSYKRYELKAKELKYDETEQTFQDIIRVAARCFGQRENAGSRAVRCIK